MLRAPQSLHIRSRICAGLLCVVREVRDGGVFGHAPPAFNRPPLPPEEHGGQQRHGAQAQARDDESIVRAVLRERGDAGAGQQLRGLVP